jgi:hypothetical protein
VARGRQGPVCVTAAAAAWHWRHLIRRKRVLARRASCGCSRHQAARRRRHRCQKPLHRLHSRYERRRASVQGYSRKRGERRDRCWRSFGSTLCWGPEAIERPRRRSAAACHPMAGMHSSPHASAAQRLYLAPTDRSWCWLGMEAWRCIAPAQPPMQPTAQRRRKAMQRDCERTPDRPIRRVRPPTSSVRRRCRATVASLTAGAPRACAATADAAATP